MSPLVTILLIAAALLVLIFVGGLYGARRRAHEHASDYSRHLTEADQALEQARASDKGWDRAVMEDAVREALARAHPGATFDRLDLVLVDDRPGVEQDRAHFEASSGNRRVPVVVARSESGWAAERVG